MGDSLAGGKTASLLTPKQKQELNQALLDYLQASGYSAAFEALKREAGVEEDAKQKGVLEKKWASIVRLQRKINDLEAKVTQYEAERSSSGGRGGVVGEEGAALLPRQPAKFVLKGHRDNVTSVRFHPNHEIVCSASEDATIRVWDFEQGRVERTLKGHTGAVRDIAFDSKGTLLVSCSNDLTIKIWDFTSSYTCTKTLHGHDHTISSVRFTPAGDQIVSCSRDNSIKIWETATGYCKQTLLGHSKWVRRIDISNDGTLVISGSMDQSARIWDLRNGKCIGSYEEHDNAIETVAFVPAKSAHTIARGIAIKNATSPSASSSSSSNDTSDTSNDDPNNLSPEHSNKYAASAGRDKLIKIFEISSNSTIMTLAGHDNWVRDIYFHPDGKHLISVSDDRAIKIWDLKEQRCIKTLSEAHEHFIQCLDFSVRNPHLATGSVDNSISIWPCR
jgi:platelet-activating factor acetylhydrolase IB subunit alpha